MKIVQIFLLLLLVIKNTFFSHFIIIIIVVVVNVQMELFKFQIKQISRIASANSTRCQSNDLKLVTNIFFSSNNLSRSLLQKKRYNSLHPFRQLPYFMYFFYNLMCFAINSFACTCKCAKKTYERKNKNNSSIEGRINSISRI